MFKLILLTSHLSYCLDIESHNNQNYEDFKFENNKFEHKPKLSDEYLELGKLSHYKNIFISEIFYLFVN